MTENDEPLQQQLDEIAGRFLERTLSEVPNMQAQIERLRRGAPDALKTLQQLAHRIYGSGAMFGFEAIGNKAHEIEMIAAAGEIDPQKLQLMEALLAEIDSAVRSAAQARGLV